MEVDREDGPAHDAGAAAQAVACAAGGRQEELTKAGPVPTKAAFRVSSPRVEHTRPLPGLPVLSAAVLGYCGGRAFSAKARWTSSRDSSTRAQMPNGTPTKKQ